MSYRQAKRERNLHPTFLALLGALLIAATVSPPSALAQDPTCARAELLSLGAILHRHHPSPSAEPDISSGERLQLDEVIALVVYPLADCQADDLPTSSPAPFAESCFVVTRRDVFNKDVDPWDDDGTAGVAVAPGRLYVLVVEIDDWIGEYGMQMETMP